MASASFVWHERKDLITRNVHVKYESPTSNERDMAYVKFTDMSVKSHGQGNKVKSFGMN